MQEVVIGGWTPGEGRREGGIGSLLLGVHDEDGRLVYAGHVGTGFTQQMLDDLAARLRRMERKTSPFADEVPRAARQGRALGDAAAGRRGGVRRVDPGRPAAPPDLARAAPGQVAGRRRPRVLTVRRG